MVAASVSMNSYEACLVGSVGHKKNKTWPIHTMGGIAVQQQQQQQAIMLQISFGRKVNADSCEKEGNPKAEC